jgi:trans-aconitate methyltransferase
MAPNSPAENDALAATRAEVERASHVYYHTPLQLGIDNRTKRFVIERCEPFVCGPRVLELGYIDGTWTDVILGKGWSVDVVEGATGHVAHARQRYGGLKQVRIFHQLFQEFRPDQRYETILAADVLRYIPDAAGFLRELSQWLAEGGRLIATLPNSRSLHRRIGTLMNIQRTPTDANARDSEIGNLRSYDRYEFRQLLLEAGYEVNELRACFLKPFSSLQMQDWSDDMLRAFLQIGDELEDYCWFMYAVGAAVSPQVSVRDDTR